jgi:hypothetical protein
VPYSRRGTTARTLTTGSFTTKEIPIWDFSERQLLAHKGITPQELRAERRRPRAHHRYAGHPRRASGQARRVRLSCPAARAALIERTTPWAVVRALQTDNWSGDVSLLTLR